MTPEAITGALITWLPLAVIVVAWLVFVAQMRKERAKAAEINEEIRTLAREQVALQRETNEVLRGLASSLVSDTGRK